MVENNVLLSSCLKKSPVLLFSCQNCTHVLLSKPVLMYSCQNCTLVLLSKKFSCTPINDVLPS